MVLEDMLDTPDLRRLAWTLAILRQDTVVTTQLTARDLVGKRLADPLLPALVVP